MQTTCERPAGWAALECVLEEYLNPFISLSRIMHSNPPQLPRIPGSRSQSNFHLPIKLHILILSKHL